MVYFAEKAVKLKSQEVQSLCLIILQKSTFHLKSPFEHHQRYGYPIDSRFENVSPWADQLELTSCLSSSADLQLLTWTDPLNPGWSGKLKNLWKECVFSFVQFFVNFLFASTDYFFAGVGSSQQQILLWLAWVDWVLPIKLKGLIKLN